MSLDCFLNFNHKSPKSIQEFYLFAVLRSCNFFLYDCTFLQFGISIVRVFSSIEKKKSSTYCKCNNMMVIRSHFLANLTRIDQIFTMVSTRYRIYFPLVGCSTVWWLRTCSTDFVNVPPSWLHSKVDRCIDGLLKSRTTVLSPCLILSTLSLYNRSSDFSLYFLQDTEFVSFWF